MAGNFTDGITTTEKDKCIKHQKITDKFKIMMCKAHKAQRMVLLKRADDLLLWGANEQNDFSGIFKFKGEDYINIRKYGENTGKRLQARMLMMDGIRRMMTISNGFTMESFRDYTKCNEFAAFVEPQLDPPYIVNIGMNFEYRNEIKNAVTGAGDSYVSTLCHEMSHIWWCWKNNQEGGMWTQDYTGISKFATSKKDEVSYSKHISVANELVASKKEQLFENAYNIERYFQIKLADGDIDAMDEDLLKSEVDKKIAILMGFVK